jgi:succinyl-CoA synthetase alpha subunit
MMAALRGNPALTAATRVIVHRPATRSFSSYRALRSYEDTVQNLRIGKHTRVIYQVPTIRRQAGFTAGLTVFSTGIHWASCYWKC